MGNLTNVFTLSNIQLSEMQVAALSAALKGVTSLSGVSNLTPLKDLWSLFFIEPQLNKRDHEMKMTYTQGSELVNRVLQQGFPTTAISLCKCLHDAKYNNEYMVVPKSCVDSWKKDILEILEETK